MTKKSAKAEVNSFTAGINTEASPLNFPPNASRDEENFDLNKNGVRERRLGIDYEADFSLFDLGITSTNYSEKESATFKWTGVGGDTANSFIVIQVGNILHVFDSQVESISGTGFKTSITVTNFPDNIKYSFASVDGYLVVVSGEEDVFQVTYDSAADTFSSEYNRIKVRDLWGVENIGSDYETDVQFRDTTAPETHYYNLRNQSWAFPRRRAGTLRDPIFDYFDRLDLFPSNAESIWTGMATVSGDTPVEVFLPTLMRERLGSDTASARGFFLIDLLRRGNSRLEEYVKNQTNNSELIYTVSSLPADITVGGPSVVSEYAGRVWFAGFGGVVTEGDKRSPNLSSYIVFSQLVNSPKDIFKCYQQGDPTSRETSDIVDTDGGFIRISGANEIIALVPQGRDLLVLADNGVWSVTGGSDFGFTASNYSVTKLSSYGCVSSASVVIAGDKSYFWSEDGIYVIQRDQFGSLVVNSLTQITIQTLYDDIPVTQKERSVGFFDPFDRKIRWLYNTDNIIANNNFVFELIFDTNLGVFTKNKIYNLANNTPEVIGFVSTDPYRRGTDVQNVIASVDNVLVLGDQVVVTESIRNSGTVTIKYVTVVAVAGAVKLTFSSYRNTSFKDWFTANGAGVDAKAFLLTGNITADDSSLHKQTPYLVAHFFRTEDTVVGGVIQNQSGCLIRSQWDWASSTASGKWSPSFQAYRYRRPFFVTNPNGDYDNGFETVVTRNKIRGRGRAFSFYMETEAGKDCRIIGWNLSVNGNSVT